MKKFSSKKVEQKEDPEPYDSDEEYDDTVNEYIPTPKKLLLQQKDEKMVVIPVEELPVADGDQAMAVEPEVILINNHLPAVTKDEAVAAVASYLNTRDFDKILETLALLKGVSKSGEMVVGDIQSWLQLLYKKPITLSYEEEFPQLQVNQAFELPCCQNDSVSTTQFEKCQLGNLSDISAIIGQNDEESKMDCSSDSGNTSGVSPNNVQFQAGMDILQRLVLNLESDLPQADVPQ